MDYEKIGALIRRLRTRQGLTQRQLAGWRSVTRLCPNGSGARVVPTSLCSPAWPRRWAWSWRACCLENYPNVIKLEEL